MSPYTAYTTPRIVKCQKTLKHPTKSDSRNSIILFQFVVSGTGRGHKKQGVPRMPGGILRQPLDMLCVIHNAF